MMGNVVDYVKKNFRRVVLGATVGLVALVGSADNSSADLLQFSNQGPAISGVTSFSANLKSSDDSVVRKGFDEFDHELDISISPTSKNFVAYFPFQDDDGDDFKAGLNFIPQMEVGDTYTAYLAFSTSNGGGVFGVLNKVSFSDFDLSENVNGVTDLEYELKVDTWGGNNYNYFDEGIVEGDMETEEWIQYVFSGSSLEYGGYYGEITFTAIRNPKCADFNGDFKIDDADLNLLLSDFGGNIRDLNYDGVVNEMDLKYLAKEFGGDCKHVGNSSFTNGVPEPSSGVLLGLGAFACLGGMRRFGRNLRGSEKKGLRNCGGLDSIVL